MAVAGLEQQAAESASRRWKLAAILALAALPPALAGALLVLSPPVEIRHEPAIRPSDPKRAALPPFWYEAEIPVMEAAVRHDPNEERARYRLLQLHAARNDTAAAQEQLKLLIEQHPESPLAVKAAEDWIAALIRTREEQDLCWLAGVWERSAAKRPDSAPALANAAVAMERCGRFGDAITLLESARRLDPENPELLRRLAGLFVRTAYSRAPEIRPALRRHARLRLMSTSDAALLAYVAQHLLEWPPGGLASNPLTLAPAGLHEREKDVELFLRRALRLDSENPIAKRLKDLRERRCRRPSPPKH